MINSFKSYLDARTMLMFLTTLPFCVFSAEFTQIGPLARAAIFDQESPFFPPYFGGQCSGTYITNDGYFLTALHCLLRCNTIPEGKTRFFTEDQWRKVITNREIKNKKDYARVIEVDVIKAKSLVCNMGVTLVPKKDRGEANQGLELKARIISLGAKGYIYWEDQGRLVKKNPEFLESLLKKGFTGAGNAGDFVLMKMEANPTSEKAYTSDVSPPGECLPLAAENVSFQSPVWSFTYPRVIRPNLDSRSQPLFSSGKVIAKQEAYDLEEIFRPGQQALSIDAEVGSSGGSYINQEGKVSGVLVVTSNRSDHYQFGSTLGTGAEHIIGHLRQDIGDEHVEKILSGCKVSPRTESLVNEILNVQGN